MTQIDNKAMQKALHAYAAASEDGTVHLAGMQDALEAYESAKAPRTITREELERAALKVQHDFSTKFGRTGNLYASDIRTILADALATLGITVEGV